MAADPKTTFAAAETEHCYCIRIADKAGEVCAISEIPTGAGPVGYRDGEAVCDMCMLDDCTDLGPVLALVAVSRAFGAVPGKEREASQEGLAQLGAVARVFEFVMGKRWERRGVDLAVGNEVLRGL